MKLFWEYNHNSFIIELEFLKLLDLMHFNGFKI